MNRVISLLLETFILSFICSCGEDRTYEYKEKTERNHWIMEIFKNNYLWALMGNFELLYYFFDLYLFEKKKIEFLYIIQFFLF